MRKRPPSRSRSPVRLAWGLCALNITLYLTHVVIALLPGYRPEPGLGAIYFGGVGVLLAAYSVVGALVTSRRPGNALGWILCAVGSGWAVMTAAGGYGRYALLTRSGELPGGLVAAWMTNWAWAPSIFLTLTFVFLLFPDGRLPSRSWRPLAWVTATVIGLTVMGMATAPGPLDTLPSVNNPLGTELWPAPFENVFALNFVCAALCVASVFARLRGAAGEERQQLRCLLFGGAVSVVTFVGWAALLQFTPLIGWIVAILPIPVSAGVAILKYRLYDIDVVISKTIVFGVLAGFITVVYVAIVVGVGSLVGSGGEPNLGLSVAATAVVAVAFGPVRERVQRLANRLVYGVRATPYEVLSSFSARVGDTVQSDELLDRMARLLAGGTGAARARVWLRVGDTVRPAAAWPDDDDRPGPQTLTGQHTLAVLPGADAVIPVVHHGELLGALTLTKARGETLTPTDDKLLADLAAQAGLVLRNVRLTAELYQRLEDLRASRQRLVAAQDSERRRLERDLHDGAQQQLVALKIKLGLAKTMAEREEADKTAGVISGLVGEADEAITTLRDLARGIYPPLLAAEGLPTALRAQAAKAPLPVTVEADGIGRYPQDTEAAVYFCCLEALQNTAKYARAAQATVTLAETDGALAFTVADDGVGFDSATTPRGSGLTNMTDRLHAHDGSLTIESAPRAGTAISGRVPLTQAAVAFSQASASVSGPKADLGM